MNNAVDWVKQINLHNVGETWPINEGLKSNTEVSPRNSALGRQQRNSTWIPSLQMQDCKVNSDLSFQPCQSQEPVSYSEPPTLPSSLPVKPTGPVSLKNPTVTLHKSLLPSELRVTVCYFKNILTTLEERLPNNRKWNNDQ